MTRTTRWLAVGAGLLAGGAGAAVWRWKQRRLDALAADSALVTTERGAVEVARRGSGHPVVVLHGEPGGYDQGLLFGDALFGDALFGDDVEVVAPSRPGYLRTPLGDNGSPSAQAALFAALLDELDIDRALVVGVSGGGPAALQLAADHPERVSGLLLASAVTTEIDAHEYTVGNPLLDSLLTSTPALDLRSGLVAALARFAPDVLIERALRMWSTLEGEALEDHLDAVESDPAQRQLLLDVLASVLPASARIDGALNDQDWFGELPLADYETIACPALVIHGEHDGAVPISHAEHAAERLQNAELLRLHGDHFAFVGADTERAEARVRAFLESVREAEPATPS
ncbi:alpha/beta hydrolase [Halobellus sp. Atlit-31R]|nr:alpha/beta hydrolase [Halobellus sp. Atlit-31R]